MDTLRARTTLPTKRPGAMCRALLLLAALATLAAAAPSQTPTKPTGSAAAAAAFDDAYDLYDEGVCVCVCVCEWRENRFRATKTGSFCLPHPPATAGGNGARCASVGKGGRGGVKTGATGAAPARASNFELRTMPCAATFCCTTSPPPPTTLQPMMTNPGSTSLPTRCV